MDVSIFAQHKANGSDPVVSQSSAVPHLFTVRVWLEEVEAGQFECRGRVQHGLDGPAWHFQGWAAMIDFMHDVMQPVSPDAARDTPSA